MRSRELLRLNATAYHEAGHAIAAWRNYLTFKYVTIKPEAGSLGHMLHNRLPKWFKPDIESTDRQRLHGERLIVTNFAGQIAEAKFRRRRPRYGMHGDNQSDVDMAFHFATALRRRSTHIWPTASH